MPESSPWDDIAVPGADFNVRQVAVGTAVPCFWGRDAGGACLFIVDYPDEAQEVCDLYWSRLWPVIQEMAAAGSRLAPGPITCAAIRVASALASVASSAASFSAQARIVCGWRASTMSQLSE